MRRAVVLLSVFLTVLAVGAPAAEAQTTVVTFDNPAPPGAADSYLNGVYQGINFGTSQWRWSGPFGPDNSNHIYFGASSPTNRTFSFSPAPRVLSSLRVYTTSNGTLTLSDGTNPTVTRTVTTGSMQLITTGWSLGSTTVTVGFTAGWALGVDDITHGAVGPPDTVPPTVSITAPASGANLSGIVNLAASASDNVGVFGVQFYLNGVALGAEDTTPPYSINWDTATASNGVHTLLAVARDSANNQGVSAAITVNVSNAPPTGAGFSLRFFGNGVGDIDRVKILIDDPATTTAGPPADVGAADFTLEFWLNAAAADNTAAAIACGPNDNWKFGNIVVDRDRYNQDRSYGISVAGGRLTFGVSGQGTGRTTICGTTNVLDGQWHHVAVQRRRSDGWMWLYVDGVLQAQGDGPDGDISYPDNGVPGNFCGPSANQPCTFSDPYLVIGAEKHDAGPLYPSYRGLFDELRLSRVLRYTASFARPTQPFAADANTVALYHFDEGQGDFIVDSSGAAGGPSNATRRLGGAPAGPQWVASTPFTAPSAAQVGQWSGPFSWPLVPVHMAVMKTGEVLMFDGTTDANLAGPSARLWSPATGTFTPVPNTFTNIFCGGQSMLADGRLLVAGGNVQLYIGLRDTNIFDPISATWTRAANMNYVRWYPTTVTLGDGRVLVVSGSVNCAECTSDIPEIYDPAANAWSSLPSAQLHLPLYPFLFLLPDGRVLNPGSNEDPLATRVLNLQTQTWSMVDPAVIEGGSTVMYQPGRVVKSGTAADVDRSAAPSVATTYVLDMNVASPRWRQTAPMAIPRSHHYLTVLPDGSVLVTGGGRTTDGVNTGQAALEAEMWSPLTETWTTMARAQRPRLYHSTALLLPDGRVLSAGGGRFVGFPNINELNAEIYSPPYLFRGARPVVASAPSTAPLGGSFFVGTSNPASIARVTLLAPGAVTHSVNMHQRFLELVFQPTTGGLTVQSPAHANLAPLGAYMLFLIDTNGVPSIASFVTLTAANNPLPTTAGVSPASATAGAAGFTLTVTGTGFVPASGVRWNGANRTTTFVSPTQLTAAIPATDLALQGTAAVTVVSPTPGGGTSNAQTFTINSASNPVPATTALSPTSAGVGGAAFTLTVSGTSFVASSVVRWNGADRPTTFVSATALTATISAGDISAPGTAAVTVFSPAPGGGTSNAQTFAVNNPAPTTSGLAPAAATAGGPAFTLSVNGTGFTTASVVRWNGIDRPTTLVSAVQLTAAIALADIAAAGTAAVTVFNPAPGGGTSTAQTFAVNNSPPTTTGLSPTSAMAGDPELTLTVSGTGFVPGAAVQWNGASRPTTFVSAGELTATIAAADLATAGTASVTVSTPAPGGGTSNAQVFTVNNPAATTTGLTPGSAAAGGAQFTLTVDGTGFVAASIVRWNGVDRPTAFVSTGRLTATIAAADIAAAGTAAVAVFNPPPGGGTSNAQTFDTTNPAPSTTDLSPGSLAAGGVAFVLTVNGTSFAATSVVRWNGIDRPTTFVSASQLIAAIAAADIAQQGVAAVTVFNPAPGGGVSGARSFVVLPSGVGFFDDFNRAGGGLGNGWTDKRGNTFAIENDEALPFGGGPVDYRDAIAYRPLVEDRRDIEVGVEFRGPAGQPAPQVHARVQRSSITVPNTLESYVLLVDGLEPAPGRALIARQAPVTGELACALLAIPFPSALDPAERYRLRFSATGANPVSLTGSIDRLVGGVWQLFASGATTHDDATQLDPALPCEAGSVPAPISGAGAVGFARREPAGEHLDNFYWIDLTVNAAPTTSALAPQTATAGGSAFTLTVTGASFVAGSTVRWAGTDRPTTFVSPEELTALIAAEDIATLGSAQVTVFNPPPGGGTSNAQTFAVINPVPVAGSLEPSSAPAGSPAFTLTVNGSGFMPGSVARWNGSDRATAFVSASRLTVSIAASDIADEGTALVTVFSPAPGGGTSSPQSFVVGNRVPATTGLDPPSALAGGLALTLTVNGTSFVPTSVVRWNSADRPTTFVSATQLTAAIAAADIVTSGTASVVVFNPAPGGGTSNAQSFAVTNPSPTATELSPGSATAGGAAFTLTVNGTNFVAASVVRWNGADRPTTFVSAAQLTAAIAAADIVAAGTPSVTVFNPAPGGGTSNAQTFSVTNAGPTTTGLSPASVTIGGAAFTLTVNGTSFVAASVVRWNGTDRPTTFVSATQLTAAIAAADIADAGTAAVTVFNPAPGGGISNAQTFTATNPVPSTTTLSPASAAIGGAAFTLTVNGTSFVAASVVRWNGADRPTTFVSATQLTAAIAAADVAVGGTPSVTVFNPAPGGGSSNAQAFAVINPAPTTTGLSPESATAAGAAFTLTVNGTSFVPTSVVRWNGTDRPTTFVSATQLTAAIAAGDIAAAGSPSVTVFNPAPGGGTSNAQTFGVNNGTPTTTGLGPESAPVGGGAFTLTVSGTSFVPTSVVRWNGADRPTTFVSATQLTAAIAAADIAATGTASVTVFNPAPGGGTSGAQTFTVTNAGPTTTGLGPASAPVGGAAFTLTVNGTNFVAASVVRWNGADRPTTFVSGTQLTAAIAAGDIVNAGSATVTVFNPAPGGGTSNAQTFAVVNPVPATTELSPAAATAGGAGFSLTVNGTGFVPTSVVRWNGANRATTFVSPGQLAAAITAADIAVAGAPSVTVFNPAPGGGTSNAQPFAVSNPVPATTALGPASATTGGAAFTLTVTGAGFVPTSVVRWNDANRTTTFVSPVQLTAAIAAADIAAAGAPSVTVFNPAPGGGVSNALALAVNNPAPTLTGLSPASATAGGAGLTLTVNGTGFVATSIVQWNGAGRTTTVVSATQLTTVLAAADIAAAGTAAVSVLNPAPGGGVSTAQTFTISATPAGLVAAYSFNAGSGTTLADVSGNGNTGTITGATWTTAGRFGAALTFNGTNNIVTVNDSNSLDLTAGMTLEAWVFPTSAPSAWRTVVAKDRPGGLNHSLHASSRPNNLPATVVFVSNAERVLRGGTRLTANTWVHLAATYDGTTQRLYVNGVQVASRAQTGPIATSNNPLRIGGNGAFGEYFQGRIDEVRVYNRALSAAEIQVDMNTPLP